MHSATKRWSSSAVIMSSSAEAVTGRRRRAPAVQPGDVVAAGLDCGTQRAGRPACVEQVGVAVVQHPALRPGQPWSEPAGHRAGAASEVVDDQAVGRQVGRRTSTRSASGPRRRPAPAAPANRRRPGRGSVVMPPPAAGEPNASNVRHVPVVVNEGGPVVVVRTGLSASLTALVVLLAVLAVGSRDWPLAMGGGTHVRGRADRVRWRAAPGRSLGPWARPTWSRSRRAALTCGVAALVADSFVRGRRRGPCAARRGRAGARRGRRTCGRAPGRSPRSAPASTGRPTPS